MNNLRKTPVILLVCWLGTASTSFAQNPVVSRSEIIFDATALPETLEVTSSDAANQVDWKLAGSLPLWIKSVTPDNGTTPSQVTIEIDVSQICSGANLFELNIIRKDGTGNAAKVVIKATTLSVATTSLHFPSNFAEQTFQITNTGGTAAACLMNGRISSNASWLNIDPNSFRARAQTSTNVKVSLAPDAEFNRIVGKRPAAALTLTTSGAFSETAIVNVTVNRAPRVKMPVDDFELIEGCPNVSIDLAEVFEDLDRDMLRYYVRADSQAAIAYMEPGTSILTVQARQAGRDRIIVLAEDAEPAVAADTFFVTVKVNTRPRLIASNPVPRDLKVKSDNRTACDAPDTLDLDNYFSDEGCGELLYSMVAVQDTAARFNLLSRNVLLITPLRAGTAKAYITAKDEQGLFANDTLQIEALVRKNLLATDKRPGVERRFALTVDGDENAFTLIDLDTVFVDQDNEATMHVYEFSDVETDKIHIQSGERNHRLRVEVQNTEVESTRFRVRATDPCGESGETAFMVIINHRPFVKNRIQDVTLTVRGLNARPRVELNLKENFNDTDTQFTRDYDNLKFGVVASVTNRAIVHPEIIGDTLRLSAQNMIGSTTVAVFADDKRGGKDTTFFQVTVKNSNHAPDTCETIEVTEVFAGQANLTRIGLNQFFCDDDNDPLFYSAQSEADSIAMATIYAKDSLSVQPVRPGKTHALVTAYDGHGDSVKVRFPIVVKVSKPPAVDTTSNDPFCPAISSITPVQAKLTTTVKDDYGIPTVVLFGRVSSDSNFVRFFMTGRRTGATGDGLNLFDFTGEFPPSLVSPQAHGIDYYITVKDQDNDTLFFPERKNSCTPTYRSIPVCFSKFDMNLDLPTISAGQQTGYRLMSIPFWLKKPSAASVLKSLGVYDKNKWRFSEPRGEEEPIEYPNTSDMTPGKAFWLATRSGLQTLELDSGQTTITQTPFKIPLQHGWNYVGTPFNFDIPIEKHVAFLKNKNVRPVLRSYEGEWNPTPVKSMQPGKGYALFVEDTTKIIGTNTVDSLRISPDFSPNACSTSEQAPTLAWALRIHARCQQASDRDNLAAVTAKMWENEDQYEPPGVGEFVSVYFVPDEAEKTLAKFCHDLRAESADGNTWDFEVVSNIHDRVDLIFEGIAQVPSVFEVWLVDEELQITRDLRRDNHYSIVGPSPANPKRLKLVVGKKEYVGAITKDAEVVLTTFELAQNFPNPFNPASTIRYGLPHAERVTLRVYNMLGEEVATLLENELKTPGYHTAIWNGRNTGGERVGSGVYVYKLQAGSFTQARKMLLVQ